MYPAYMQWLSYQLNIYECDIPNDNGTLLETYTIVKASQSLYNYNDFSVYPCYFCTTEIRSTFVPPLSRSRCLSTLISLIEKAGIALYNRRNLCKNLRTGKHQRVSYARNLPRLEIQSRVTTNLFVTT